MEGFEDIQGYFEQIWSEIVNSTEECVKLVDDGNEGRDEQVDELNYHIELFKEKNEHFF